MGGRGASGGGSTVGRVPKLPDLTGTEKQVAWANDIRQRALNALSQMENNVSALEQRVSGVNVTNDTPSKFAEDTLGYSRKDVSAVRADIIRILTDERAKQASLIIERRDYLTPSQLERQVKLHARERRK